MRLQNVKLFGANCIPLVLRGAKNVWGETWDILKTIILSLYHDGTSKLGRVMMKSVDLSDNYNTIPLTRPS